MSVLKVATAGILLALVMEPAPSFAQTAVTTNFNVQITITAACQINSASDLNFGSNGVIASNVDASSTITVQCTNGVPYNLGLSAGAGSGATVANRKMTGPGSNTIGYSLYTTAARSTVWGFTINTDTQTGSGNGTPQPFIVYGRVPAQTTPGAGTYTDIVTATLTY